MLRFTGHSMILAPMLCHTISDTSCYIFIDGLLWFDVDGGHHGERSHRRLRDCGKIMSPLASPYATAFLPCCCRLSPSDLFVGGGTVVLEAMRAGRVAVGSDISPLALFVSRGRCWTSSDDELDRLREVSLALCQLEFPRRNTQRLYCTF